MPVITEDHSELLHEALRHVSSVPLDPLERKSLYAVVTAFVDDMRAEGRPPEQIVLVAKRAAERAGLRPSFPSTGASTNSKDALVRDIVDWCIHRYYVQSD